MNHSKLLKNVPTFAWCLRPSQCHWNSYRLYECTTFITTICSKLKSYSPYLLLIQVPLNILANATIANFFVIWLSENKRDFHYILEWNVSECAFIFMRFEQIKSASFWISKNNRRITGYYFRNFCVNGRIVAFLRMLQILDKNFSPHCSPFLGISLDHEHGKPHYLTAVAFLFIWRSMTKFPVLLSIYQNAAHHFL